MIWTDNIYSLVDNMTEELYKNLDKPHNQNCVTRAAYGNMTLQECHEVVFSLKIHTGTLDEENWESEYICIQKKDRKN